MEVDEQGAPTRGSKRAASDDYEHEQNEHRLTKRFRTLSLKNDGISQRRPQAVPKHETSDDSMHLDDTKDKIYVYDLDRELESLQEPEENLVFLPEIERRLTAIPKSILNSSNSSATNQELVLYKVPSSITVPEEQDNVRRAIIETRARAKAKKAEADASISISTRDRNSIQPTTNGYADPDAMDIE